MQTQNVRVSSQMAAVFAVCSNAAFWLFGAAQQRLIWFVRGLLQVIVLLTTKTQLVERQMAFCNKILGYLI